MEQQAEILARCYASLTAPASAETAACRRLLSAFAAQSPECHPLPRYFAPIQKTK
ncbi:hypothetical protein [Neisseria bacilliformis]|nr:hypothetical protein [Neisseria bacilliformis]